MVKRAGLPLPLLTGALCCIINFYLYCDSISASSMRFYTPRRRERHHRSVPSHSRGSGSPGTPAWGRSRGAEVCRAAVSMRSVGLSRTILSRMQKGAFSPGSFGGGCQDEPPRASRCTVRAPGGLRRADGGRGSCSALVWLGSRSPGRSGPWLPLRVALGVTVDQTGGELPRRKPRPHFPLTVTMSEEYAAVG